MTAEELVVQEISAIFNHRLYPDIAPQEPLPEFPFAVYSVVSATPISTNCRNNHRVSIQIDIWTLDAAKRSALWQAVHQKLVQAGGKMTARRQNFYSDTRSYRASLDFDFFVSI